MFRTALRATLTVSAVAVAVFATAAMSAGSDIFPPSLNQVASQGEARSDGLMEEGVLEDMAIGAPDAPNTIVEYASMTCPHCADFHRIIFPELKAKYIDTGKVRFVFRDFPLDSAAVVAAMLTRCADRERYFTLINALFEGQGSWAWAEEGKVGLRLLQIFHREGMSREQFNRCLADKELFDKILSDRNRARKLFGVDVTPTLFVNGKRLESLTDIRDIEALFEGQSN